MSTFEERFVAALAADTAEPEAETRPGYIVPVVDTDRPYTTAWTDGSSTGRVGPGGWAWCVVDGPNTGREGSGGALGTTNQRMELQAAHEAMRALSGLLLIVSDSEYVVKGMTLWQEGWRRKNWRKVMNDDLWRPAVDAYLARDGEVRLMWVKGHAGLPGNERADVLAKAAKVAMAGQGATVTPSGA